MKIRKRDINNNFIITFVGAFLAAFVESLLLIFKANYLIFQVLSILVITPLVGIIICRPSCRKEYLLIPLEGVVITVLLNGFSQLIVKVFHKNVPVVVALILGFMGIEALGRLFKRQNEIAKYTYKIKLCNEKKEIYTVAYYDSGNLLFAGNGEPVSIIASPLINQLNLNSVGYIGYETLGHQACATGLYKVGEMTIYDDSGEHVLLNCLMADGGALLNQKDYQVILHRNIIKEK